MTGAIPLTKGARQQRIMELLSCHRDRAELDQVMGTIAGDDTVLVICRRAGVGPALADRLLTLAGPKGASR